MNYIAVNNLFSDGDLVYRVLWIDSRSIICYVIDINAKSALPLKFLVKDIEENLNEGFFTFSDDVFLARRLSSSPPDEKDLMYRDQAWDLICSLAKKEPDIYEKDKRGLLINQLVEKNATSYKTVVKYLRRYWQRGLVKDCLLPDFNNCGQGKEKVYIKKTGRPRKSEGQKGINITPDIQKIFKKAIDRYYLNTGRPSLSFAYRKMIQDNYVKGYYFENNGKKLILEEEGNLPSYHQFYYWFKKIYEHDKIIRKREGDSAFERNHRALLGSTETGTIGPGSMYQIDATPADIFLVNRINPNWLIGKPTVYFVTDVFSRMITGFYVGLRNPSWIAMAAALSHTHSNKVDYCARYGISIEESDWPSKYMPDAIVGDRGELESHFVEALIDGLSIDINNNPPHRPDWKGIVEQLFNQFQKQLGPLLPGYMPKHAGDRGVTDFRQKASLTLDDYIKIIIHFVIHYNQNHYMDNYHRDEDMVRDNVRPVPIELWNWGIKNRSGTLRDFSQEIVNFYLLPKEKATITSKGIKFNKKLLYTCDKAIKENWFSEARRKTWKVDISYDPRNMDFIYLHLNEGGSPFITCSLVSHQEKYKNKTLDEIDQLLEYEDQDRSTSNYSKMVSEINLYSTVEEIVRNSLDEQNRKKDTSISKTRKINEVKKIRDEEKVIRDSEEAFNLQTEKHDDRDAKKITDIVEGYNGSADKKVYSIKELFLKNKEKNQ